MEQPRSSQPPPSSSTENPIVAVGRKVKSVLSTNQRPSVRILRGPPSTGEPRRMPPSNGIGEKSVLPSKENTSTNRFAGARNRAGASFRSLFGREETVTHDESFNEYDSDTVDLMDVIGMYAEPGLKASTLTLCRP